MLKTNALKTIYQDLSVVAFYQDGDTYCVDQPSLAKIDRKIDQFYLSALTYTPTNLSKAQIITALAQFIKHYLMFKDALGQLVIPKAEFSAYLQQATIGDAIRAYFAIKQQLRYAIIAILQLDSYLDVTGCDLQQNYRDHQDSATREVLNRHNPFADINIKNQEFIYPDTDHHFQTLRFNIGYTMSKEEAAGKVAVTLEPDFKISKTSDRHVSQSLISMDDTITTPMPEEQHGRELLYI